MTYKAVIIGGSAGSLEVILNLAGGLPAAKAVYVVVVHRKPDGESILVNLLAGRTPLPVKEVEDKEPICPGTIYVAPPDYHLLFENTQGFSLDGSEKIHFSRPSIDVTFESAAALFGNGVMGILLSGANADGADGLGQIQASGGTAIIQDPATADVDFMPQEALKRNVAATVATPDELLPLIERFINR